MRVRIKKLHKDAIIPTYGTSESACVDLYAIEDYCIRLDNIRFIKTGVAVEIPVGYYGEIYNRSGLATKKGLVIVSSRIIDSDFRGELVIPMKVIFDNVVNINKGDRIAQMMVKKYDKIKFEVVDELDETERGEGGFGSTGR